jgi:hypothetical protein
LPWSGRSSKSPRSCASRMTRSIRLSWVVPTTHLPSASRYLGLTAPCCQIFRERARDAWVERARRRGDWSVGAACCCGSSRLGQLLRAPALMRRMLPQIGQLAVWPVASMAMNVVQPLVLQRSWREPAVRRSRRWAWARRLRWVRVFGERDNILDSFRRPARLSGGHHVMIWSRSTTGYGVGARARVLARRGSWS